ncbi:MAG: DUF1800 domain-containing protein [Planctomycetota bacterium]|jgi:uncharacterized protein (DUF1800 family)
MQRIALALVLLVGVAAPAPTDPPADAALAPLPAAEWTPGQAAHLLRRAGFGGTLEEVRDLHALGPEGAVDRLLAWEGPDPNVTTPPITVTARPGRAALMGAPDQEARQRIVREWRRKDQLQFLGIREWWMQTMIATHHPLRERMVLFWHGHFTSGFRDVRNSYHLYVQNTLFRRHAAGDFRALLHAISRDPAMLEYLDNNRNRKQHPNENYAREVMELFTLGAGNYTEHDIKEAARALTGWTLVGNRFYFDRRQHDAGPKEFLGRQGNFGGDEVLDIILEQPAASRHLAARIYRYFVRDLPDRQVVEGLARTLRAGDWQLEPMLRQLFRSRAFYAQSATGTKIKSPVELLVGIYRGLGLDARQAYGLSLQAQVLGQSLMDPPNVKGWPGGRDWITTSHLLNRYNLAGAIVGLPQDKVRTLRGQAKGMGRYLRMMEQMRRMDPSGAEMEGMDGMDPRRGRARRGRGALPPSYDVVGEVRRRGLASAEEIVAFYGGTLLAHPLSDEMRATLVAYLNRDGAFRLDRAEARALLHGLLRLIVSTPEFQLT